MKKYFTTLNLENDKFVGMLHDPDTNAVVYKTKSYTSQSQVTTEINQHLTNLKTSQSNNPQTIINTTSYHPVPVARGGRCCGR
jgi:hypothetical protein